MDHTFTGDGAPTSTNSTNATDHIATNLAAAGKTWRSYQEDLDPTVNGACPIVDGDQVTNHYAAKHDPFVFFKDVSGSPPSMTNTLCSSHHKAYTPSTFQADLTANDVADYTFITPNLCDDMHGSACSNLCITNACFVTAGDTWLSTNVPPIIDYINAHEGVLLLVWDEPESSGTQPFIVVGPHVKKGHASSVMLSHNSYVLSLKEIFGLSSPATPSGTNDFSDFFEAGYFP
jgi:phospholipase C